MKIGLVQYSPEWENREANIAAIENLISDSDKNFDLLIFPEMTLTGFTMKSDIYAEELDGTGTKYFIDLAQRIKKHLFTGIIEKDDNKVYNSLVHFDKNGLVTARYRKVHPFSFSNENKYFNAGKETVITNIDKKLIGLSVCYDLRFPELYRYYGKKKADMMINIANWPVVRIEHWKALLRARAIENLCYMIGVNRTGTDPYNEYNGRSVIYDPMGNEVILTNDEEKIFTAEINLDAVTETRTKLPFLEDVKLI